MTQPYIGQVTIYSFNFAPRGWAICAGSLVSIAQYQALFAIIGTTYGGNGTTNFALPNIQERGVMSIGTGPGLSTYDLGEPTGVENATVLINQMPSHNHQAYATAGTSEDLVPSGNGWFGEKTAGIYSFQVPTAINTAMSPQFLMPSGNTLPHENRQPFLAMNYCIALEGIYPSHN